MRCSKCIKNDSDHKRPFNGMSHYGNQIAKTEKIKKEEESQAELLKRRLRLHALQNKIRTKLFN